ncbi:MAG TPA: isoprenylcysteine carboxylmethyltransferase family protein [Terriglobales bacterium]|jgi:protein-S-isoprenylcysteine O-methyltransferase Ste14|nr:isoprenylcysteine carboxylmethyltransferase family protein [Terriglobales bacterium]
MPSWSKIARRIRVPLGFAFAVLYVWLAKPSVLSILLGLVLVIPGLAIRALASGHVRKNEQLTTSGPYAYTRNPLYLGSLILALGFVVASRSWWIAGFMLLMFLAIYIPVIKSEEDYLRGKFSEFDEYARMVPRLIPRIKAPSDGGVSFSKELYLKHREYNALLGALAVTAFLVGKLLWISK